MRAKGFTLVELLVVLAVLSLLTSLAAPRYFAYVDRTRETVLQHNLQTMRDRIAQFRADRGRSPRDLLELVEAGYLREVPVDPITERKDTWKLVPRPNAGEGEGVMDVRSGAPGKTRGGIAYANL